MLFSKQFLLVFSVAIFAVFIGSQITEGVILVPYWQSLSTKEFYIYYNNFGPKIGLFYTVLTIIAALIPIVISVYCKSINSKAFKFSLISSLLAILFVSSFYIYFKGTNELFYQAYFNDAQLKKELIIWASWHWSRVFVEILSLVFLILALIKIPNFKNN
jgi:hypothetical protein